ncbi:hypothetical protein [Bacillus smithii]|uniref:hypothetical protein n=1 Tax=Bacillus smithii TaxID=1479 RepID=UPI002E1CEBBE|nr:hypothetical protein [Bacillus smithii]MED4926628.1 hypothetical protein [Bacillus smithii]
MENLAAYITSENANMDILLKRTWSKVDDGNGPDGVYRSHIMTFPSPSKISIYPYSPSSSIMRVTNLEVAFGVSSWGNNTSPKTFYIQYTNDPMASVNDSTTDNKWITVKSYTSWNHQSGIVNIPVDFTCRKMRIVVDASYQSTYYLSTVFRVYGEIKNTKYLFQDGTEIKKYVSGTGWTVVGVAPVTKAMFDSDGINDLSIIDNNAIQQLTSDTPELLCWTDEISTIKSQTVSDPINTIMTSGQINEFSITQADYYHGIQSIKKG